jgi:hypothetical protein
MTFPHSLGGLGASIEMVAAKAGRGWVTTCGVGSDLRYFPQDYFVQISELQKDGQLRNVIRRNDFDSRIRNAAVIGSLPDDIKHETDIEVEDGVDDDAIMSDSNEPPSVSREYDPFPPHLLLLVLENGDCVFMFLRRTQQGTLTFVDARYQPPDPRLMRPGFHLAVDPSFQYMALSCAEGPLVVCELESVAVLGLQYARGQHLRPVKSCRPRAVSGVVQQAEFLHPLAGDVNHIILLLIIVKNAKSRMVTFEWVAGDDLDAVLKVEKGGHRLPFEHQMPLLLIPLTVRTAFLAISPSSISVCKDVLEGAPNFENFELQDHDSSAFYHGREEPLWTAWARPYRLTSYFATRDYIYLAREDGVVTGLDIDSDNILGATVKIVKSNCNISTAFCSIFDEFTDILVMGGDSGPGAIWQVGAKIQFP